MLKPKSQTVMIRLRNIDLAFFVRTRLSVLARPTNIQSIILRKQRGLKGAKLFSTLLGTI